MLAKTSIFSWAAVAMISVAYSAKAQVVYTNGPIDGLHEADAVIDEGRALGIGANIPSLSYKVSDSFTVSASTNLTRAAVGVWNVPGEATTSITWSIGTTPFGNDVGSGNSATSDVFDFLNDFGSVANGGLHLNHNAVYTDTFAISGFVTPGNQYWFTLSDAIPTYFSSIGWDINAGPSTAYEFRAGTIYGGTPSHTFTLYGNFTSSETPEPGGVSLVITSALFCKLASVRKHRRHGMPKRRVG